MAMVRRVSIATSVMMMVCLVCDSAARAQEQPNLDPAALEKAFQEFAKMAPQHELFKKSVGKWKTEARSYYENPDQPTVSEGSSTFKLLMDGRYLVQNYKGEYNGQKFQGMGLTGFDKSKQKYVSIWIDSMGTGIMSMEGQYDEKTQTVTEAGVSSSPIGDMKLKNVIKHINEDKFHFAMYMVLPDGKEVKSMEITYSRVK